MAGTPLVRTVIITGCQYSHSSSSMEIYTPMYVKPPIFCVFSLESSSSYFFFFMDSRSWKQGLVLGGNSCETSQNPSIESYYLWLCCLKSWPGGRTKSIFPWTKQHSLPKWPKRAKKIDFSGTSVSCKVPFPSSSPAPWRWAAVHRKYRTAAASKSPSASRNQLNNRCQDFWIFQLLWFA